MSKTECCGCQIDNRRFLIAWASVNTILIGPFAIASYYLTKHYFEGFVYLNMMQVMAAVFPLTAIANICLGTGAYYKKWIHLAMWQYMHLMVLWFHGIIWAAVIYNATEDNIVFYIVYTIITLLSFFVVIWINGKVKDLKMFFVLGEELHNEAQELEII